MRSIIMKNGKVKVNLNTIEEDGFKSATTKIQIILEYVNSGNSFYDCVDEFGYQDKIKNKINNILLNSKELAEIEL